jgi:tetratricopeptide (TPR) repeat protein
VNDERRGEHTTWLLAVLLALATFAIYSGVLANHFVEFDDPAYITANPHVLRGLTWTNVAWAFTSFDEANWHPLTWLSHMTDVELFGVSPAGHHATSIVIHALNAALLFLILFWATGFRWRSLMVAALFALHPMNVENVAWAAERKSLLGMFFSLVTVGLYGRFVRHRNWKHYAAVVFAFALALMSKPMAVTLPLLLLLFDYWPLNRFDQEGPSTSLWSLILEKLPLFAMSAASSLITIVAQKRGHSVSDLVHLPLSQRLANAAVATVTYARRTIWPNDLSYFYPHPGSTLTFAAIATAIGILIGISLLVYRFREHRYLVVGWLLFLLSLLPVIGILQVGMQAMADRYAYLPTTGLFIAVIWTLADLAEHERLLRVALSSIAVCALAALAGCTVITEGYWHDNLTLFTRAHEATRIPNSYIETNYAAALLEHHREAEALEHFRIATQLAPNDFAPHYDLGFLLAAQQNFTAAAAQYEVALRCAKQPAARARVLYSLGIAYLNSGDRPRAAKAFEELLRIDPDNAQAKSMLQISQQPQ